MKQIKYDLESELKIESDDKALNLKIKRLKDLSIKLSTKFKLKNLDENGISIVALIFGNSGKAYFFSPGAYKLNAGDVVRVHDSSNEVRMAAVVIGNSKINEDSLKKDLRPVIDVIYKNPRVLPSKSQ